MNECRPGPVDPASWRVQRTGPALHPQRDAREPAVIGREARLDLVFERRGGRTTLARSYVEPPFRIGRCLALDDAAYIIIVCSGPGVFAGDRLRQTVHLGAGARVVLTSQAALQVHPGVERAPASIDHDYTLGDGAELHCDWDPVIPFAGARLAQGFTIDMPSSAWLYWSDALMAGRVSRGEAWRFHEVAHELRIRVDARTSYLERYRITPDARTPTRPWIARDARYFATTVVRHPRATSEIAETCHRALGELRDVRAAVDAIDPHMLVARMTAADGVPFARARSTCRGLLLDRVFDSPRLQVRKTT